MRVDDRLGEPDGAETEHIAHQHHGDMRQHHADEAPGDGTPDRGGQTINRSRQGGKPAGRRHGDLSQKPSHSLRADARSARAGHF
jgi:hypothetical protein